MGGLYDQVDGIPLHPLAVHGAIVLIVLAALGGIALALHKSFRARYGLLCVGVQIAALATTHVAVESGKVLTAYPGLGSESHADAGELLLLLMIPFVILNVAMVMLDRRWMLEESKHGVLYRRVVKREPVALTWQPTVLDVLSVASVAMALVVLFQVAITGHSGASGTWQDVLP